MLKAMMLALFENLWKILLVISSKFIQTKIRRSNLVSQRYNIIRSQLHPLIHIQLSPASLRIQIFFRKIVHLLISNKLQNRHSRNLSLQQSRHHSPQTNSHVQFNHRIRGALSQDLPAQMQDQRKLVVNKIFWLQV